MKCEYCIWKNQCEQMNELGCGNCSDFTAYDDSQEVEAYEADLAERHSQYLEFAKEFN